MCIKAKFGVNQGTKQCFFCARFNGGFLKGDSDGVFELNNRWDFSRLAFIWLFLNQVKSLSDVDCNLDTTVPL